MNTSKLSPKLLSGIMLAIFLAVALGIRVWLPYDRVFSNEWIRFIGTDALYHMRIVDLMVHNFPHFSSFDPYFIYPGGGTFGNLLFFDWLLAGIIWVIGLGSPTTHTIDIVGVYFPAVLGALTLIPAYFIGKELFNRWVGVFAAGLLAVLPSEFLGRSILGFTDHHVAEVLFTTMTTMFLVLAIKASRERGLTFSHLWQRNWTIISKPIIYSLLAGSCLGIYLITWQGALLFVFIISLYFIIQFIIDHLKHQPTGYLGVVGFFLFLIALAIYAPIGPGRFYLAALIIAVAIPPFLEVISQLMASKKIKPAYYPLTLVILGGIGLAIFYAIEYAIGSRLLVSMLSMFSIFMPRGAQLTTTEMQPFLFPRGYFSLAVAWGNFNVSFFLSFISLGILFYLVVRRGSAEKTLLLVWGLLMLLATLGQRRFAYYFAVNVALLSGYLSVLAYFVIRYIIDYLRGARTDYMSGQILELTGFEELVARPTEPVARAERRRARLKRRRYARFRPTIIHTSISIWVIVVFFVVFFPCISPAMASASQARFAPSDAWVSSLYWMKENTPDPFGDPDFYYQLNESPQPGESYSYPESAYGVTAWWDYGYLITRIAHRMPTANPGQSPPQVINNANILLSQDEELANDIMGKLNSLYIIIDNETVTSKFDAIVTWAGREHTEFFDFYFVPQGDRLVPVPYYYPEYYRSLCSRLYNFDGKAVTPKIVDVISYQEDEDEKGNLYKVITSAEEFGSYEEAEAYLLSQESADYRIIGVNPFISPVPLEALEHYQLIHSSDSSIEIQNVGAIPAVKIFEYSATTDP